MKRYELINAPDNIQTLITSFKDVFGVLSDTSFIETFTSKETIIAYNRPIRSLRFLLDGKAKISLVHENGNQSIVHFLRSGEYVGELTFLEIEKEHKNVIAISDCTFISINMLEAKRVLRNDSDFLYKLAQFIGNKMLHRTSFNSKNQNYELRNRLAAYILATQCKGFYSEKHTETAEYLAVSYRHLLYTIQKFIEEGLLTKQKKGFSINDSELSKLAKDITIF